MRVIPYQISKKKSRLSWIFMKFGTNMDSTKKTFSHQNLANSIDLPLRYDHLNFILKYLFSLHMFNQMAITLSVIVIELLCLDFWNAH